MIKHFRWNDRYDTAKSSITSFRFPQIGHMPMNPQEKESNWKCNRLSRNEVTSDYASQRFDCLRRVSPRRYGRLQVNVTLQTILLSCDWLEFQSVYIAWVRPASCSANHDDLRTGYLKYYLLLLFYQITIFLIVLCIAIVHDLRFDPNNIFEFLFLLQFMF